MSSGNERKFSRKQFMKGAGITLAGIALTGGSLVLAGCNDDAAAPPAGNGNNNSQIEKPSWPFNYVRLDPDKAAQVAYDSYKDGAG